MWVAELWGTVLQNVGKYESSIRKFHTAQGWEFCSTGDWSLHDQDKALE